MSASVKARPPSKLRLEGLEECLKDGRWAGWGCLFGLDGGEGQLSIDELRRALRCW